MDPQLSYQPQGKVQYQANNNIPVARPVQPPTVNNASVPKEITQPPFIKQQQQNSQFVPQSQILQTQFMPQSQYVPQSQFVPQSPTPQHHCPYCNACQVCKAGHAEPPKNDKKKPDTEYGICEDCSEPDEPIEDDEDRIIDDLKTAAADQIKKNKRLRNQMKQLMDKIKYMENLPEENDKLQNQINDLEGKLDKAVKENKGLLGQNALLKVEKDGLQAGLDKANGAAKDNDDMKKQIADLEKKAGGMGDVLKENDDLKNKLGKLKGDRDKMLADINALERLNGGLKGKIGQLQQEKEQMGNELAKAKKLNDDLGQQVDALVNDNKQKGADLPKVKREIDKLNYQLDDLKAEKEQADKHLEYLHQELAKAHQLLEQYGLLPLLTNPNAQVNPQAQTQYPGAQNQPGFNGPQNGSYYPQGGYPVNPSVGYPGQTAPYSQQYPGQQNNLGQTAQSYYPQQGFGQVSGGPNRFGPSSTLLGTPQPQTQLASSNQQITFEQLLIDNQRMKKVIDQLNSNLKQTQ